MHDGDECVDDIEPRRPRSDVWINGGFFVFRRRSSTTWSRARTSSCEPFQRLIEQRQLLRLPSTRASGRRWTPSRTGSSSRTCTRRGDAPWELWRRGPRRASRLGPAGQSGVGLERCCASGRTADDIEIGCGGTVLPPAARRTPGSTSPGSCSAAAGERAAEARASADAAPRRRGVDVDVRIEQFREGYFPYDGAAIKEPFDELGRRGSPDLVFTHSARRPAPGPPARLRAHLEHLPRPPDPRVRDPEVRRRSRHRRTCSSPLDADDLRPRRSTTCCEALPEPARQAVVHRGDLLGDAAPPGRRVPARRPATPRRSTAASWCWLRVMRVEGRPTASRTASSSSSRNPFEDERGCFARTWDRGGVRGPRASTRGSRSAASRSTGAAARSAACTTRRPRTRRPSSSAAPRGAVHDVIVDLRPDSPTYLQQWAWS